jgi:6-pyruvoyltetrahydropterin/6-carboxytetrahydropterin synthase
MYTLAVRRSFISRHALVGGDWGRENEPNAHRYLLELRLSGPTLDSHGFLVDIVDVDRGLDEAVGRYRDAMLNELPEFAGLNPSLENFARILAGILADRLQGKGLAAVEVVLWEDEAAWASFQAGNG